MISLDDLYSLIESTFDFLLVVDNNEQIHYVSPLMKNVCSSRDLDVIGKHLKELLDRIGVKLDLAVNLDVPRDVILDRLTTRRTCSNPVCQEIYNIKSNPPKVEGVCDKCGSSVIQRDDETEEAISKRLETYSEKTAPLAAYYEKEGLLTNVNATSSDVVVQTIKDKVGI